MLHGKEPLNQGMKRHTSMLTWPKIWPHLHGLERRKGSIVRAQARQHCGLEWK